MNYLFLDTRLGENSNIALVGVASAPSSTRSDGLYRLTFIHLIVPFFLFFPFVQWFEIDVRCLFVDLVWIGVDFSIFFVVILVLNHSLGCQEEARVVEGSHRASKVVIEGQVSVEVLIAEVDVD